MRAQELSGLTGFSEPKLRYLSMKVDLHPFTIKGKIEWKSDQVEKILKVADYLKEGKSYREIKKLL